MAHAWTARAQYTFYTVCAFCAFCTFCAFSAFCAGARIEDLSFERAQGMCLPWIQVCRCRGCSCASVPIMCVHVPRPLPPCMRTMINISSLEQKDAQCAIRAERTSRVRAIGLPLLTNAFMRGHDARAAYTSAIAFKRVHARLHMHMHIANAHEHAHKQSISAYLHRSNSKRRNT